MRANTEKIWSVVNDERRRLVDDLDDLTAADWQTPSLCPGWTVHDVVAHLVDSASTTRLTFVRRMIKVRFDFDQDNQHGIDRIKRAEPAATLAAMRATIGLTSTPPAALATRLVEAFVHGEDIRRPVGVGEQYPPDAVAIALAYQLKTKVAFGGGRERAQGCRLIATDTDFTWGSGREVRGSAIDLLLTVSGRPLDVGR